MLAAGGGDYDDDDDDDSCVIISPPPPSRPLPLAAADGDGEDDDPDCVIISVGRTPSMLPHARYDCTEFVMGEAGTDPLAHCPHCWCGICETPVASCTQWAAHARTTAAEARAHAAGRREAALQAKVAAVPRVAPPAGDGGSDAAHVALRDLGWLQLRHTALQFLTNCGHDPEGLTSTLVAVDDVPLDTAQGVIAALHATNDVATLDGELHLRPGVTPGPEPAPPGPPGPPLHVWVAPDWRPHRPAPLTSQQARAANEQRARMQAAAQAAQQRQAWVAFADARVAAEPAAARPRWAAYFQAQGSARARSEHAFEQQLVLAWTRHLMNK